MTTNNSATNQEGPSNLSVIYGAHSKIASGRQILFTDVIDRIKTEPILKEIIQRLRATKDNTEQKKIKETELPWFSFGEYHNNHRSNKDFRSIKILKHDLDRLDTNITALKEKLKADTTVMAFFDSPRGNGLKIFYELETPICSVEEYEEVYEYYYEEFYQKYGIKPDHCEKSAVQVCYFSYDPNLYYNPDHQKLPIKKSQPKSSPEPVRKSQEDDFLDGVPEGGRDNALTQKINFYRSKGLNQKQTLMHVVDWNKKNIPPLDEEELSTKVKSMYERYDKLPVKYFEKDGSYFKHVTNGKKVRLTQLTTFTIQPQELLTLPNSDCLRCTVTTNTGVIYNNIHIENTDWHSRGKLLKAIGHQDCSFIGSDNEIQALCSYVNSLVTIRKTGSKIIGLVDNHWVTEESNISASGPINPLEIIPYDKGADAFYKQIKYTQSSLDENRVLVSGMCNGLFQINTPEVIVPILGWMFAAPVKPLVMDQTGSFPILFLHGTQDGGKTSTAILFMRMNGYKFVTPKKCDMKPFPLLKLLSSTNAIPVVLDEFKVADIKEDVFQNLLRTIRESYNGEVESKGHQDQTVQDYKLDAPIVLAGEWSINQPAIKERIILVRFNDVVKKNKPMQEAYERLKGMNLESFMPAYISFCLNQKIDAIYEDSKTKVESHFKNKTIAPRIIHNLSVMVLGLELFQAYAASLGLKVSEIALDNILNSQLEEITGNKTGFVNSAVDQMIEELGAMAQKNEKEQNPDSSYKPALTDVPWYKRASVKGTDALAINFTRIFPEFKEHCRRTKYEGDLLDRESYLKMFDECTYIVEKNHPVNYGNNSPSKRSVCINIKKAQDAEINLDGFGIN
jgi:hypothetical protein